MKVYVLFNTDAWNSHDSEQFCGVFSTKQLAIDAATRNAIEIEEPLTDYDKSLLETLDQTQSRSTNFLIMPWTLDEY
jgi:hypothetical protein